MTGQVQIVLTRVDAEVALMGLKEARKAWVADVRNVGGKITPTPYDDAIDAISEQLRERGVGE